MFSKMFKLDVCVTLVHKAAIYRKDLSEAYI
jgi:hypothetical protein